MRTSASPQLKAKNKIKIGSSKHSLLFKIMILIFSEQRDYSTTKVMEYLLLWGKPVTRINYEDFNRLQLDIQMNADGQVTFNIDFGGNLIRLESLQSVWFRRGEIPIRFVKTSDFKGQSAAVTRQVNSYLLEEQKTINSFFYDCLIGANVRVLGNPGIYNAKKLSTLFKASKLGLRIPESYISNNASLIKERVLYSEDSTYITKGIQDNISVSTNTHLFHTRTILLNKSNMTQAPDQVELSLVQRKLEKEYEIRSFYLDGRFFSVAIFSQQNEKTKIDFRNYDFDNPNRKIPVKLPNTIENKLKKLLKEMGLNTASIDLVFTTKGEYVFLEVNPVGQFDMVGKIINNHIDKEIALWLSKRKRAHSKAF